MKRREILGTGAGVVIAAMLGRLALARDAKSFERTFEVSYSAAEWERRLTKAQYYVLREHGTERPFSSNLLNEKRAGTYACAGCGLAVYRAADKFDSGTGWPSFMRAVAGNVGTSTDTSLFMTRTEVHCRRCGGHLGHVFDDGPPPTGKRHCINGDAMRFVPATRT